MIVRKPRPKIRSKNKSYDMKDSALYNLSTKKRLSQALNCSIPTLKQLSSDTNYRVFDIIQKGKVRQVEAPLHELGIIHARIASLLVRISVPEYLHSGVKGRSHITNANVHIGPHPVLTLDIRKFYPSVSKKSIYHFFSNAMKASPDVAGILAELCSYKGCVPTGSRLSMLIAFWANHPMYSKISSFAQSKEVKMTIFVDDFTFSGMKVTQGFRRSVEKIISDSGFTVHPTKTRLYRKGSPKLITGVIVTDCETKVKNMHHKSIYSLFQEMDSCTNDSDLLKVQKKLIGSMNAAGQIDSAFKQRARQLRKKLLS